MEVLPLVIIYVVVIYLINNQLSYIRKFKRMRLFNSSVSRTLSDIGIKKSYQFKQMQKKGIFVLVKENKYFMEEEKSIDYARKRRSIIYTTTFFFVILFLFIRNNF